jgi:hypothetical protein
MKSQTLEVIKWIVSAVAALALVPIGITASLGILVGIAAELQFVWMLIGKPDLAWLGEIIKELFFVLIFIATIVVLATSIKERIFGK